MFRERRKAANPKITISELADAAGVAALTVQKIEKGNIENPGIKTVYAIEEALTRLEASRKVRSPG